MFGVNSAVMISKKTEREIKTTREMNRVKKSIQNLVFEGFIYLGSMKEIMRIAYRV